MQGVGEAVGELSGQHQLCSQRRNSAATFLLLLVQQQQQLLLLLQRSAATDWVARWCLRPALPRGAAWRTHNMNLNHKSSNSNSNR